MAETLKTKLPGCMLVTGTATMAVAAATPYTSTITVKTGMNRVLSAVATYTESPEPNAAIYRTISGGEVTFTAYGNQDSIDIDYQIIGI